MIDRQLRERRKIQHDIRLLRHQHGIQIKKLNRDMGEYLKLSANNQDNAICQHEGYIARKRQIKRGL